MSEQPPSAPGGGGGGQIQNPFQGLTADKIKNAGIPIQLMLGAGIVFFIFSFFDWWSVDVLDGSVSGNAWDDFLKGGLPTLLMLAVGVVALFILLRGPNQNLVYAVLGGSALALLLTFLYLVLGPSSLGGFDMNKKVGSASFGLYIALIAAIASTAGAVMLLQEFQKRGRS